MHERCRECNKSSLRLGNLARIVEVDPCVRVEAPVAVLAVRSEMWAQRQRVSNNQKIFFRTIRRIMVEHGVGRSVFDDH